MKRLTLYRQSYVELKNNSVDLDLWPKTESILTLKIKLQFLRK